MDKMEDYGTFFYKLRNGSLPFEYDTNNSIEKINKSLNNKTRDLFCGLASAIIANCVSKYINTLKGFLIALFVSFIFLEIIFILGQLLQNIIVKGIENRTISEAMAEKIQDLFFRKVLVQTTYVFSVVKRIQEIGDNSKKKELKKIYSMQGIYGIRKISVELGDIFSFKNLLIRTRYVNILGKENVQEVIKMLKECMKIIKESYPECVKPVDEKRLQFIEEKINNIPEKEIKVRKSLR